MWKQCALFVRIRHGKELFIEKGAILRLYVDVTMC